MDQLWDILSWLTTHVSATKLIALAFLGWLVAARIMEEIGVLIKDSEKVLAKWDKDDEKEVSDKEWKRWLADNDIDYDPEQVEKVEKWEEYEKEHGYDDDPWEDERKDWKN